MEAFMGSLRWLHITAGFIGLAAFWVPIFTRKGGANHRLMGKVFKYCAYVVLGAAGIAVVLHTAQGFAAGDTLETHPNSFGFVFFLGYLALVTYVGLRHGIHVLLNKQSLTNMDRLLDRLLAWSCIAASVALIAFALIYNPSIKIILFALSPIGFATGYGNLQAIKGKRTEKKAWFYEHMGNMIGTGIAFHTAFAVFGASRLFNVQLSGPWAVIPWIAPAVIGITAVTIWTRYYKRKFGDLSRGTA